MYIIIIMYVYIYIYIYNNNNNMCIYTYILCLFRRVVCGTEIPGMRPSECSASLSEGQQLFSSGDSYTPGLINPASGSMGCLSDLQRQGRHTYGSQDMEIGPKYSRVVQNPLYRKPGLALWVYHGNCLVTIGRSPLLYYYIMAIIILLSDIKHLMNTYYYYHPTSNTSSTLNEHFLFLGCRSYGDLNIPLSLCTTGLCML